MSLVFNFFSFQFPYFAEKNNTNKANIKWWIKSLQRISTIQSVSRSDQFWKKKKKELTLNIVLCVTLLVGCLQEESIDELQKQCSSRLLALKCDVTKDTDVENTVVKVTRHIPQGEGKLLLLHCVVSKENCNFLFSGVLINFYGNIFSLSQNILFTL